MNAQNKIAAPTGLDLLRQPFPDHHISKLPKPTKAQTEAVQKDYKTGIRCKLCQAWHHPQVVHLDYVGHAALTDRLLDADVNWTWDPVSFGPDGLPAFDQSGGLWIKLTVCGQTRLGYGNGERKTLDKTGGDRIKEVIGDALRNAAMRFGAALDLWHKGDLHLGDDAAGGGSERDNSEERQVSPDGPAASMEPLADRVSASDLTKIQMLLKATSINEITFLRGMGAPKGALLCELPASMVSEAIERLETKLAGMAKQETNAKVERTLAEELDDAIDF